MVIAYVRISTAKQDSEVQKLQIYEYCIKNKINIDEVMEVEMSSRKSLEKRRMNELKDKLNEGDLLICTELSRLGRSMLEVITLILELSEKGVQFVFLRQPELSSFNNPSQKLLLSFYAYVSETERDFISQRTKAGLANARKNGKNIGRPTNSFNSMYDKDEDLIKELISKKITLRNIWKFLGEKGTYNNFHYFCKRRKLT
ncbi:site-specific recombinase/resolvase [Campylobacter lari]|uniref:Site-specific recombinase/resolvase n=3 Tax=Campylobacter TaxID=194 RepID=B9KGG8_CAMLR|nr:MULTISPECIES: site-specific recombinase/resolvase [Campylobacter]MCR8683750.1 site-specific recombinase/resolvase [Campylobacter sp. LMG 17559]MCR8708825.1 site-specific recombinase/resolvase [Campylobacter sp. RM5063]MCR8712850.1 site-specific recombinase/resolvase [Campylobacter sp. W0066.1]ACM64875.1 site-specific recombinase/resolvase [Campylobacter lari RM2100]AJC85513.1 site-specific recombinase/resolvase [Campylobacter peloridis LMG 23910]